MDSSSSYMDSSSSYMDSSSSYMDSSSSYMDSSMSSINLNEEFINTSGGRENEASFNLTISRDADGNITFTEHVPIFDTLTDHSAVTLDQSYTFGLTTVNAGEYMIDYSDGGYLYLYNLVESSTSDYYFLGSGYPVTGDGINEFISAVNDETVTVSNIQTVSDGLGDIWNGISITQNNYIYIGDDDVPRGDYIVTVNGSNEIRLNSIGEDTDFDSIPELNETTFYSFSGWELGGLKTYLNDSSNTTINPESFTVGTDYETAADINYKMDGIGSVWNSVNLSSGSYVTADDTPVPVGFYQVSIDSSTGAISLQATKIVDGTYDVDNAIEPYVLSANSASLFTTAVNSSSQPVVLEEYKQYFYDLINDDTVEASEAIDYAAGYVTLNDGTQYVEGVNFDNTSINFINTDDVTGTTSLNAGDERDFIAGGVGGFNIDGGSGLDIYLATPTNLKIVTDQNGNILEEGGVKVDLSANRVIYLESGAEDVVANIEYFMGTLGDDQFIGSALHSTDIDDSYINDIQVFNPTAGKDEIFGAETITDLEGNVIDVFTAVDYDGLQGGQGVIFILDGSDAATYATEGAGEISLAKISEFAGEYWNDTSWAGDGWLPSDEDILNENGHLSTVSQYEVGKQGATLILDSFGDTDLAFDVDHYIGSGEADIFYGSTGNDSFDAVNGTGNYMSGGAGLDQLVVTDQNELESDGSGGSQDAGEDLDLDSITVNRNIDYNYSNRTDVEFDNGSGKIVIDNAIEHSGAASYRIDFADVHNLSDFFESNLSTPVSDLYTVSSEYALFLRTTVDLGDSASLPASGFTFDSANLKIDVEGTDISVLDQLSGQLVLAQENTVVEGYIVQGFQNDGAAYSTVIEDVEQVSLLSDDASYFGTDEISGEQEDIYQLIIGGQGDLGEMLYVETGEMLSSTTGVGTYSAGSNFINGEIFYSGHHTDFDRNTTNPSNWANSVASAFEIAGQDTAKIWNDEVAQFFVWYDLDTTDNVDGYEISVKFQNGNINAWGIDNRQFDTFQNVTVDQSIADAINLQFGDSVSVELGEYRILYEAAYTDIETLISSDAEVTKWNFDFQPTSSRSTFYIQVGGEATGENGSAGIIDNLVTNIKVERVEVDDGVFDWLVNPQAEILVNLPTLAGATETDNLMISGNSAETIEGGRGSDVMMGRGGSDNYKINAGDTLDASGAKVEGSYGVAGDVINEIGGSSEDKSDAITLSSAKTIDELTFTRTEIASEYWGNTLQIDVAYTGGGNDTLYVFDHYNQNLQSRAVEQLFLDDGWDSNEIWNLIVGDVNGTTGVDEYIGTAGQDVLIAGTETTTLYGGDGQDIMIGDKYSKETTFELGNRDDAWDQVADIIEGFGAGDKLDLSALGITAAEEITVSGSQLQFASDNAVIAEFSNFKDSLTLDQLLTEDGAIIYA